jgi:DNA-binding TFAR19-related protein (PDSD5 family)
MDLNQLEQLKQIEEMKNQVLGKILTREASERLARVRAVNPNLAAQAELYLIQIYQQGKLKDRKLDDGEMKDVLKLLSDKKEINIKRK